MSGIAFFSYFSNSEERDPMKLPFKIYELMMLILFPIFSFFIVHHHRNELVVEKYTILYGPLYRNLRYHTVSVFLVTPLFCISRFSLALTTGLFPHSVIPCAYSLFVWTIVSLSFYIKLKPMTDYMLNLMEKTYFVVIYFNTFFMFIFTPWVSDLDA